MAKLSIVVLMLIAQLGILSVAYAAPKPCPREDLAEFTFRIGADLWSGQLEGEALRDAVYDRLGEAKRTARKGDDLALQQSFANREGLYDWLDTKAGDEPTYRYMGRLIDCLNTLDIRQALWRRSGKEGVISELKTWRVAKGAVGGVSVNLTTYPPSLVTLSDTPDSTWFVRHIEDNLDAVVESRKSI